MAITRWDKQEKPSDSENKENRAPESSMSLADVVADINKKNPFLKTPMKRRREDKKEEETAAEKRWTYLKEKAKQAVIPTETGSVLHPEHIFQEKGPLIIYLCGSCRKYNSTRPITIAGEGKMQLPLAMCSICRAHLNRQRSVKFFEHELPTIKRDQGL